MKLYALIALPILVSANLAAAETLANQAKSDQTMETRSISLSDLDLSNEDDVAMLKSRIRAAITAVCKQNSDGKIYFKSNLVCIRDAEAVADKKITMAIEEYRSLSAMKKNQLTANETHR
jgi:UrcA family protein